MAVSVLVVEDDKNIAELLQMYLEKEGYAVTVAHDGGAGLSKFRAIQPDLVLLDVMMPVMDGWAVCRAIRSESQTPIIMLTAKGETDDKVTGLRTGADDYITKPFEMREVLARIEAVLRRTSDKTAETKSRRLSFDKLTIDMDAFELTVDGKKSTRPPRKWSFCSIWPPLPTGSTPATSFWTKCGASTTSATAAPWMSMSSGSGKSWRASPTSGPSRPSGALATSLRWYKV